MQNLFSKMMERFKAKKPDRSYPGNAPPRVARKLFVEEAVNRMMDILDALFEADIALTRLGETRGSLRQLEYDDEICAALESRKEAAICTPWRLEPGAGPVSDFLWEEMEPVMETLLRQSWNAVPYGYSVQEVVYRKRQDGKTGIDRVIEKPFEWFKPKRDGTLRWFPADGSGGAEGVEVDTTYKFLLTRRQPSFRNPSGEALLSRLYSAWFLRKQGYQFWAQFLERAGIPLLVGKTGAGGNTLKAMTEKLYQAVQDAVIAVGQNEEVASITPGGTGETFDRFEKAISKRIQKLILGQTLTTDVDGKGSYAAAKVHSEVKQDRRNADIRVISRTVQNLIDALASLNFPNAKVPDFIMEDGTGLEAERAERDVKLKQIGVNFTPAYFTDKYDMEPEHFILSDTQSRKDNKEPDLKEGDTNDKETDGFSFAARPKKRFTKQQNQVEELIDSTLEESLSPIPSDVLREQITKANNPDDLINRLARVIDNTDPAYDTSFQELAERALFTADVLGYSQSENKGEI